MARGHDGDQEPEAAPTETVPANAFAGMDTWREYQTRTAMWAGTKAVGGIAIAAAAAFVFPPLAIAGMLLMGSAGEDGLNYLWTSKHRDAPGVEDVLRAQMDSDVSTRQGKREIARLGRERPAIDYTVSGTSSAYDSYDSRRYDIGNDGYSQRSTYRLAWGETVSRSVSAMVHAFEIAALAAVGVAVTSAGFVLWPVAIAAAATGIVRGAALGVAYATSGHEGHMAKVAAHYTAQSVARAKVETGEVETTEANSLPTPRGLARAKASFTRVLGKGDTPDVDAPEPVADPARGAAAQPEIDQDGAPDSTPPAAQPRTAADVVAELRGRIGRTHGAPPRSGLGD